MPFWQLTAISCGVSLDLFATTLAIGMMLPQITWPFLARALPVLTIPSIVMLIAGQQAAEHWLHGSETADRIVTPLTLGWIGSTMIAGHKDTSSEMIGLITWLSLLTLGWVASLDVGMAGIAMGIRAGSTATATLVISAFTIMAALAGLLVGSRLSHRVGRYAEITGGTLLVGIAEYCCFS